MAEAFVFNMNAVVTKDYLEQCLDARLTNHDLQFAAICGELKLHRWMLALIAASTVIPALQKLFAVLVN